MIPLKWYYMQNINIICMFLQKMAARGSKNAKFLCLPVGIARYFRRGRNFFSILKRWATTIGEPQSEKRQKKFGSLKNGCTFALAFAGKTGKRLRGGGDSSLKRLKQEIACVRGRARWGSDGTRRVKGIEQKFLQWRVWSWLRMNASGRPNTCKSRGSGAQQWAAGDRRTGA